MVETQVYGTNGAVKRRYDPQTKADENVSLVSQLLLVDFAGWERCSGSHYWRREGKPSHGLRHVNYVRPKESVHVQTTSTLRLLDDHAALRRACVADVAFLEVIIGDANTKEGKHISLVRPDNTVSMPEASPTTLGPSRLAAVKWPCGVATQGTALQSGM